MTPDPRAPFAFQANGASTGTAVDPRVAAPPRPVAPAETCAVKPVRGPEA